MPFTAIKKGFTPVEKIEDEEDDKPLLAGNIDLSKRRAFDNGDGTFRTLVSKSFQVPDGNGEEILIPTVDPETGDVLSDDDALALFDRTGKHLGIFKDAAAATRAAKKISAGQNKNRPVQGLNLDAADETIQANLDTKLAQAETNNGLPGTQGPKKGFTPAGKRGLRLVENKNDNNADDFLPDTVKIFNPFGEDFDTGIPLSKQASAFLVNAGGAITRTGRGIRQLTSDEAEESEADNERLLRLLRENKRVGGAATAGDIVGTVADPILLAIPLGRAKTGVDLVKQGAGFGFAEGFFKAKEKDQSRFETALKTAAITTPGFLIFGQVMSRLVNRSFLPFLDNAPKKFDATKDATPRAGELFDVPPRVEPTLKTDGELSEFTKNAVKSVRKGKRDPNNPQVNELADEVSDTIKTPPIQADDAANGRKALAENSMTGHLKDTELAKNKNGKIEGRVEGSGGKDDPPITNISDEAEPFFTKQLNPGLESKVNKMAKEFFANSPGNIRPGETPGDAVVRFVSAGGVPDELLAKHGLTNLDFAGLVRATSSNHGRRLQELSVIQRQFTKNMSAEERIALRKAGGNIGPESDFIQPFWKKTTNLWRASLVTQPATAVRNFITQQGFMGMNVLQAPMDHWLQRMIGRQVTIHPMDGFELAMSIFSKNKKANVDKILSAFPGESERLFHNYVSDVTDQLGRDNNSKIWNAAQSFVDAANILNRGQEYLLRRGIFQASLRHELRNKGKDLNKIIENNELGQIDLESLHAAQLNALEKTFAATPEPGTVGRKFIDFINSNPFTSIPFPFPRFMVNSLKFTYEFSPMGIVSILKPSEIALLREGKNVRRISRFIIGSGLTGAGFQVRNSEFAGEKWYEINLPNGEVADARPFAPFSTYLFMGDLIKRYNDGTLGDITSSDIIQGIASTNFRAGTGAAIVDEFLDFVNKNGSEFSFDTAKAASGNFLAGFFTFASPLRDFYDQHTDGMAIIRDTSQDPFLGPIFSKLPVLSQTLPIREFPTRDGPKFFTDPAVRQFTGVSTKGPKNALEKELDRLGFERREILGKTGDKDVDREIARVMGRAVEAKLIRFGEDPFTGKPKFISLVDLVANKNFQQLSDGEKGFLISDNLRWIRKGVNQSVKNNLPLDKTLKLDFGRISKRERLYLEEQGVKEKLEKRFGVKF